MEPAFKVILIVALAYVAISMWKGSAAPPAREPYSNWMHQDFATVPPTPFVLPKNTLVVSSALTAAPTPEPTPEPTPPPPTASPVPVLTELATDMPSVTPTMVPTMVPDGTPDSAMPTHVTLRPAASPLMMTS